MKALFPLLGSPMTHNSVPLAWGILSFLASVFLGTFSFAQSNDLPSECPFEVSSNGLVVPCRDVTPDGFQSNADRVVLARVHIELDCRAGRKFDRIAQRIHIPPGYRILDVVPRLSSDSNERVQSELKPAPDYGKLCVVQAEEQDTARFEFVESFPDGSVPVVERLPSSSQPDLRSHLGFGEGRWGIPGDFNAGKQGRLLHFGAQNLETAGQGFTASLLLLVQVPSDWEFFRAEWDAELSTEKLAKKEAVAQFGMALGFYNVKSKEARKAAERLVPQFRINSEGSYIGDADESTQANWKKYAGNYRYDAWLGNIWTNIDLNSDGRFSAKVQGPFWSNKASGVWTANDGRLIASSCSGSDGSQCGCVQLINEDIVSLDPRSGTLRTSKWILKKRSN